jgi:ribosomal protein L14E/L6E/L27E
MAHDEFNSGARHGFSMALYAVRNIDRLIEYPNERGKEDYIKYNAQKDLLYKIYEEINNLMKEEVHENDY